MKPLARGGPDAASFRHEARPDDREKVGVIAASSGFFSDAELEVAVELVDERLSKGVSSGYHFVFAELGGEAVGYACFGPIPCTASSWDLYWIAVMDRFRGMGLGRRIMEETEAAIRAMGGARIYIDTSSRKQYAPTRGFYESCGYSVDVVQEDFYAPGDSRVVYVKKIRR